MNSIRLMSQRRLGVGFGIQSGYAPQWSFAPADVEEFNSSVYAQYTIQVKDREKIINYLKEKGIPTAIHYPILLPDQPALNKKKKGFLP